MAIVETLQSALLTHAIAFLLITYKNLSSCIFADASSLTASLSEAAFSHYKKACSVIENSKSCSTKLQYKTYLDLADFCHKQIGQDSVESETKVFDEMLLKRF